MPASGTNHFKLGDAQRLSRIRAAPGSQVPVQSLEPKNGS
jgi:hypothetical protein